MRTLRDEGGRLLRRSAAGSEWKEAAWDGIYCEIRLICQQASVCVSGSSFCLRVDACIEVIREAAKLAFRHPL